METSNENNILEQKEINNNNQNYDEFIEVNKESQQSSISSLKDKSSNIIHENINSKSMSTENVTSFPNNDCSKNVVSGDILINKIQSHT